MIKRTLCITALLAVFIIPLAAGAQSQCFSDRAGYCIKLSPQGGGAEQQVQTPRSNLQAAGLRIVGGATTIPGLEFLGSFNADPQKGISFGDILVSLYYFLLGIVGIAALIVLVFGGIRYMLAREKDPTEAKRMMTNAILGLLLALTSYLILYTINPDLVAKLDIGLQPIIANVNPGPDDLKRANAPFGVVDGAYVPRESGLTEDEAIADCSKLHDNGVLYTHNGSLGCVTQTTKISTSIYTDPANPGDPKTLADQAACEAAARAAGINTGQIDFFISGLTRAGTQNTSGAITDYYCAVPFSGNHNNNP